MRPTATGNSAVDASVGTTWERPKQVSWRNVPVDHRFIKRWGLLKKSNLQADDSRLYRVFVKLAAGEDWCFSTGPVGY